MRIACGQIRLKRCRKKIHIIKKYHNSSGICGIFYSTKFLLFLGNVQINKIFYKISIITLKHLYLHNVKKIVFLTDISPRAPPILNFNLKIQDRRTFLCLKKITIFT